MSSFTNPRRSNGMTPTSPICRKGATFHSPEPSENLYFTPPSLPRRSQTSLEDVIDAKKRRAALALEDFDRIDGALPSTTPTVQSYRDEGLPFPQGLLHNTIKSASCGGYPDRMDYIKQERIAPINERKASLRPQRQTRRATPISDSGLGSSIMTKSSVGGAVTAITMSAAPVSKTHLQRMSRHASGIVNEHILQKLLANQSFKDFHPIVRDCPRAIEQREIVCLRDLEKTLTLSAPVSKSYLDVVEQLAHWNVPLKHRAKTADLYLHFCESTILCIRTALTIGLSDHEQTRPTDRPYTPGYFTDLVAQVRQAALQIAASREKEAKGEELDETDAKVSDEIKLYGGLTENGRPAELVRIKNGKAISMATGELVDMDDAKGHPMKRSLSEEDEEAEAIYRSMARRKKSATAAELAPKRCGEPGCDKEFKRSCDLTKHQKTHARPWKCRFPDCRYYKEGWPTEKELLRHENDRHSKEPKMYNCLFKPCTYKSKRESNAKQHMEKAHNWTYVRSKSNGKKRKDEGSVQMTTPSYTGVPTPIDQNLDDEYENQNNDSETYEHSVPSRDDFEPQNYGLIAYENSANSPEYSALSNFSPNFNDDIDMDIMPQLHVENYLDSPNSNLRHGSTDSSIPSPYGGDNPAGFRLENGNGAFTDFPTGNNFDFDFDLFNNDLTTSHMQLPQPSVYQQQLPEFTGSACSNDPVQQISPGGHGNHVLYTPPSMNAVDEGFEDYAPGEDFPLFASTTASNSGNSMMGMNPTLSARVPLFGEVSSTQDMYPTFLNTQECMDLSWEMS